MSEFQIIDLTPENIGDFGVCGYKDVRKHRELRNKIEWFTRYYPKGLRIKVLLLEDESYQGMIEYIPGTCAHRPVEAEEYMFIHCIFLGFRKDCKGRGYASRLIRECVDDAKRQRMKGVAVVTREGPFMAGNAVFLKNGFRIVDTTEPDFSLAAITFDDSTPAPRFMPDLSDRAGVYGKGLTVIRSAQCPYTEKNVQAILEAAEKKFSLDTALIDIKEAEEAQASPCAFGTFCLVHNGEIISWHPISGTRFENIMKKRVKGK